MKVLLAAAALAGVALLPGTASAADLPAPAPAPAYKAPAMVPPAYSWTGFYLNAGGGYGEWTADTQTIIAPGAPGAGGCVACVDQLQSGRGWMATAGGGFDLQFGGPTILGWTPQLLVGLMGDYNYSGIKGTIQDQFNFITGSITERSSWAVGGRVGLIVFPQFLTYTNAGYTNSHFSQANMVFSGTGVPTNSSTPAFNVGGWFLGGGTETTLAPLLPAGWFLRSEYRYAYYGTKTLSDRCPGPTGVSAACGIVNPGPSINFHPTEQTLTTSLIYKFNWQ